MGASRCSEEIVWLTQQAIHIKEGAINLDQSKSA
jgi:hypothetical protein